MAGREYEFERDARAVFGLLREPRKDGTHHSEDILRCAGLGGSPQFGYLGDVESSGGFRERRSELGELAYGRDLGFDPFVGTLFVHSG